MNDKVQTALNEQIKNELYSAYLYLSMAAYFESEHLPGMAGWMKKQSQEEVEHAMKIFEFVNERGGRVTLEAIAQPPVEFESPLAVFEKSLEHEKKVTAMIHALYALAVEEKDYPAQVMLQWFVSEQVEEENTFEHVVTNFRLAGDAGWHLLVLDNQMANPTE